MRYFKVGTYVLAALVFMFWSFIFGAVYALKDHRLCTPNIPVVHFPKTQGMLP